MKRNLLMLYILLSICAAAYCYSPSGGSNPESDVWGSNEVLPLVGLQNYLEMINNQNFHLYGFEVFDEVLKLKTGRAIELFSISPLKIMSYKSGTSIEQLLETTHQYYIPLLSGGTPRCMALATIEPDGKLHVVSLGYAKLAGQLEAAYSTTGLNSHNSRLVVVFQAKEFFLSNNSQPLSLVPIQNSIENLVSAQFDLEQNIHRIQPFIESAMKQGR